MIKPMSVFLAFRYFTKRNSGGFSSFISASSTLGIALGVMVLIIVLSAMNGFEKALSEKLLSIIPHAEIEAVNEPIDNWPNVASVMQQNSQVLAVAPVIKMTGMLQKGTYLKGVEIRGVSPKAERVVSDITDYLIEGNWQNLSLIEGDLPGIVIGAGVAKKLKVSVGDTIQVLLPKSVQVHTSGILSNQFPAPTVANIKVVGVFKFGGMVDETLAYIHLAQAQALLDYRPGEVNALRIKVRDVFSAPQVIKQVAYTLNNYVYIHNWTRTQGHLFQDIQLVRMVASIVLALVIAVASFNIVSTLIMVVNEKKGDIAILKTMGANPSLIMLTFVFQGLINGLLGCSIGAVLGVYLAKNLTTVVTSIEQVFNTQVLSGDVYFIDFIPTELHMSDVYITVAIALSLSLVATIYPSWRATKVEPAAVLGQL